MQKKKSGKDETAPGGRFPRASIKPLPSLRSVLGLDSLAIPQESPPSAISSKILQKDMEQNSGDSSGIARQPRPRREQVLQK